MLSYQTIFTSSLSKKYLLLFCTSLFSFSLLAQTNTESSTVAPAHFDSKPAAQENNDLPANPKSGRCYIKCISKDEFKEKIEILTIQPAYKKLKIIPGTTRFVAKQVLVKEASKKMTYVPAVYESVDETYSSPESEKLKAVPAKFKEETKTFETYPAISKWEYKTLKDCPSANKEACMTACYVEYPAKDQTIPVTVLDRDATIEKENIAGKNGSYKKQVIKTPARVIEEEIPAQYSTIKVTEIVKQDSIIEEVVPAVTKAVTITELVKKGGTTYWEEVDCGLTQGPVILPILYEYNSSKLTDGSVKIIDEKLYTLMTQKPNIRIQIMSHTDARGNAEYNMSLSQKRAQSVVNHLISKGVSKDRLEARGFGKTRLKNRCNTGVNCSEKEHQENRRTEFAIIQ